MRQTRPTTRRPIAGFTLIELLVTISIIVLLIAITFPFIALMRSGSRLQAGVNTIGMAADVARQWVEPAAWEEDSTDSVTGERYSGTAAIYCPTGEIRIVSNFRNALRPNGSPRYLEELPTSQGYYNVNGYWEDQIGFEYIKIPSGVSVVGVRKFGGSVELVAPPFAIAFDEQGHLSYGDGAGYIYYDGDQNGVFGLNFKRDNSYNPADWDGKAGSRNEPDDKALYSKLPFDAIECVPSVIVYDAQAFEDAGFSLAGGGKVDLGSQAGQWLQENGEAIFFSPHTGVALKNEE